VEGNSLTDARKPSRISSNCISEQAIGCTLDFWMLVHNLDGFPKISRMLYRVVTSCLVGAIKMDVSST
jgi:hypothetical protein